MSDFELDSHSEVPSPPTKQPQTKPRRKFSLLGLKNNEGAGATSTDMSSAESTSSQFASGTGTAASDAERPIKSGPGTAGNMAVYDDATAFKDGNMIRERVSLVGAVRPMEPFDEMEICGIPTDEVGVFKPDAVKRYLEGINTWQHKFKHAAKNVERQREKSLKESHIHAEKMMNNSDNIFDIPEVTWRWQWALDNERPPPASIVARRDTQEARKLVQLVDKVDNKHASKAVNLWTLVMHLLSPLKSKATVNDEDEVAPWTKDIEELKRRHRTDDKGQALPESNTPEEEENNFDTKKEQWLKNHVKDE